MSQVERVVTALASQGRVLSAETVERQLGGLEGLPSDLAADALLRTYSLAPDGTPLPGFEPDRTSRGVIIDLLRESRSNVTYVFVAALIGLVPAIAVPLLMRVFVDRYIVAQDTTWGLAVVLGLIVAGIMVAAVVAMQSAACKRLQIRLNRTGNTAFAWSMLTMRIPNLQRFGTGELIGRLNAVQLYALQAYLLPQTLVNSLMVVVFLVIITVLDVFMGLAALAIVVVVQLISRSLLLRRNIHVRRYDTERIRLSGYTSDVISSAESIKAAAWEQFAFARWAAVRDHMSASRTRLGIARQYTTLVPVLAQSVGLGVFLAIGVAQVFAGTVSLGTVVASQAFMVALLTSSQMITYLGVVMQMITSSELQFGPVTREPIDPEMLTVSGLLSSGQLSSGQLISGRLTGAVALHAVDFGYDDAAAPLLSALSLEVHAGRRIAIVGPSGSGKTTIAKLITGELRPWSGYVSLDGAPRLTVPRDRRTRDIAYVPQTTTLFPGTIRDNLTLWDESITEKDLVRAARDACIEDMILGRPGAFFHEITSTNGGFSGGELQRLAIARALAGDPRVIVLDEATSALDPVVEAEVEARLRAREVTVILVAHRLSTIRDADEILVVDGGRIVQRGTFNQLSHEGLFAELVHG